MSFFAVQVCSGSETEVKKMLQDVLFEKRENMIGAIYALESYTQIVNENTNHLDLTALSSTDIDDHLFIQRLQANLSNLRFAYGQMQGYEDSGYLDLIEEYRHQIKDLTSKLKDLRNNYKKIDSVLKGYILIELNNNFHYLPKHLWHLIKSIPKVTGFPSRMNIPQQEINVFFEEVQMSAEVELKFNEVLSYDEHVQAQSELLHQANQTDNPQESETIVNTIDDMNTDVVAEVSAMKQTQHPVIQRVKAFIKNKRKTVSLPVCLFRQMYHDEKDDGLLPAKLKSSSGFIHRLWRWLRRNDVMLA
ncbi:transcription termination/antitermination NusG family protein [Lentibacillus amyloliquefaciens]|uniref:Uncharacterized protein n=1 Tax=Lentibacillus amyloliquefaciens TaxID=1472767 RepID=A0A0U3W3C8_9BACI|nr:transcription termination/antitermination NusG family protein [Lentibacillus amyloliquefaciens]ALX47698.1 hypothetical protein AOX59_03220 [Lentibacillus amyloliquefaciens]